MTVLPVLSSKAQLKIQQMAFVLIAFVILFGFVAMFYLSIRLSGLREDATTIRHNQAQEEVRRLAGSPEFSWTEDSCASCVDMDKILALKNRSNVYQTFWGKNIQILRIEQIYPSDHSDVECTYGTYPSCGRITLLNKSGGYSTDEAFVALCRLDETAAVQCTLGRLVMGVSGP